MSPEKVSGLWQVPGPNHRPGTWAGASSTRTFQEEYLVKLRDPSGVETSNSTWIPVVARWRSHHRLPSVTSPASYRSLRHHRSLHDARVESAYARRGQRG